MYITAFDILYLGVMSLFLLLLLYFVMRKIENDKNLHIFPFLVDGNSIFLYNSVVRIIWGTKCLLIASHNKKDATLNSLLREIEYDGTGIVFAIIEQSGEGKIYQYDHRNAWHLHGITAGIA